MGATGIPLTRGVVDAVVIPDEGGVLSRLRVAGREVLATTPWASDREPTASPAATEADWVDRWRGGWQLCFPSAGEGQAGSPWPQGFHGVASQAPWRVRTIEADRVVLDWSDEHALTATRTWSLTDSGAEVETVAVNHGTVARPVIVAEHLILGGDLLAPVIRDDATLTIVPPIGAQIAPLDYEGRPVGERQPWPGAAADRWSRVDRDSPARVAALVDVEPRLIRVEGAHASATVTWHGLPHALVWEELARSTEPPWNGSVIALGIEPTSAPHGRGTAIAEGTLWLEPGSSMAWGATLAVDWLDDPSRTTQGES